MVTEKRCPKCCEYKAAEEFYKNKRGQLTSYCKKCSAKILKQWSKDNPAARKIQRKKYYQKNKEWLSAYNKEWRINNPEKWKICHDKANMAFCQSEKGIEIRRINARNRVHKIRAGGKDTYSKSEWESCKELFDYRCAYCGKRPDNIWMDHLVPVSSGGRHDSSNIVPSCPSCNMKKHSMSLLVFLVKRSELLESQRNNIL